jgi:hypothetical protein
MPVAAALKKLQDEVRDKTVRQVAAGTTPQTADRGTSHEY